MTYEETLYKANQNPNRNFHIFIEFMDGKRGYHSSRETLRTAKQVANLYMDAIVYDRDGTEVYDTFGVR